MQVNRLQSTVSLVVLPIWQEWVIIFPCNHYATKCEVYFMSSHILSSLANCLAKVLLTATRPRIPIQLYPFVCLFVHMSVLCKAGHLDFTKQAGKNATEYHLNHCHIMLKQISKIRSETTSAAF